MRFFARKKTSRPPAAARRRRRLTMEGLERRDLLTAGLMAIGGAEGESDVSWTPRRSPYTNPLDAGDVNADRLLATTDALAVISDLFLNGSRQLTSDDRSPSRFLDVNADGAASTRDALEVVRALIDPNLLSLGTLSELDAELSGPGAMRGRADWKTERENAVVQTTLRIQLEDAAPGAAHDVFLDGVYLATLLADNRGRIDVRYASHPSGGELPLPPQTPVAAVTSTISVGDEASGLFSVSDGEATSEGGAFALLHGEGAALGEAEYEIRKEGELDVRKLKIRVEHAAPGERSVTLGDLSLAPLAVQSAGKGELVYSDAGEPGSLPFPDGFPTELGDLVLRVGGLEGAFASATGGQDGDDEHLEPDERPQVWESAANLTISFPPDGTDVSGRLNELHAAFGAGADAAPWQRAILDAFQTWTRFANINFAVVQDSGAPLGSAGLTQGDPRFGDIRIVGAPLAPEVLAVGVAQTQLLAGSWAGDIVLNTQSGVRTLEDLTAVILHEVGHVLGLEHSADPRSPMHPDALGALQPTAADIAALQARYGARRHDIFDRDSPNNSFPQAAELVQADGPDGFLPLIALGDLTNQADTDFYEIRTRSSQFGPLRFDLNTQGRSMLRPSLTVFDANGAVLASGVGQDGRLSARIAQTQGGARYFARVTSTGTDPYAIGSYALIATFENSSTAPPEVVERVARGPYQDWKQEELYALLQQQTPERNADGGTNDTPEEATQWMTPEQGAFYYRDDGAVETPSDRDYYRFAAPESGEPVTTVVAIDSLEFQGLIPSLELLDEAATPLAGKILSQGAGRLVVQFEGLESRQEYHLGVSARNPAGAFATGNYQVQVTFANAPQAQPVVAQGELTAADPLQQHTLYVAETQLFHLAVSSPAAPQTAMLWATLYNENGEMVYRSGAAAGDTANSGSVILTPGSYLLEMNAAGPGQAAVQTAYTVLGDGVGRPIGPEVLDPTLSPFTPCPEGNGDFCYPNEIFSPDPWILVADAQIELPDGSSQPPGYLDPDLWFWQIALP